MPGKTELLQRSTAKLADDSNPSISHLLELGQAESGLRQDAELHGVLQTIRADDFRSFASLLADEVQVKLANNEARSQAILDRWFELDPACAKAFAEKVCKPVPGQRWSLASRFHNLAAASAARQDPQWALEHLLHEREFFYFENPNSAVICEAAKCNASLAKEWMKRMENNKLRESLLDGYVQGIAERDPVAALDFAIAEKGFQRVNIIPTAVRAAASQGRGVALEALAKINEPVLRRRCALQALQVLGSETNTDIIQFFEDTVGRDHLKEAEQDPPNAYALIAPDPLAAANWAAKLPPEQGTGMISAVLEHWRQRDPKAAKDWIEKYESSAGGDGVSAMANLTRTWRAGELLDAGNTQGAIALLSDLTDTCQTLGTIVFRIANEDPATAAQWALNLPDGKARELVAGAAADRWTLRDPAAVAEWIEQLPGGAARDRALNSLIDNVADQDPESASEWVGLFTDPQMRESRIRSLYSYWAARDPAAAREWVRTLPGLDERWKTKFLRQNP